MQADEDRWEAAQEGAELLREGLVDEAIGELERVCLEQPENPYGFYFLGNAHFEKQDWTKALKGYLTALELEPEYLGAMVGAGHTLRMMGRPREAIRMARQILGRRKEDADGLYLLGLCHYQMGEAAAAKGYLERFLETNPEVEIALEVEGILQVLRGEVVSSPTEDDIDA